MSGTLQILEEHAQYARNQRCTCGWRPDYALDHLQHPAGIQHTRHLAEVLDRAAIAEAIAATLNTRPPCDPEAYAAAHNDGYETAVAQGLADDPSLADDWLQDKLQEARTAALYANAPPPDPKNKKPRRGSTPNSEHPPHHPNGNI